MSAIGQTNLSNTARGSTRPMRQLGYRNGDLSRAVCTRAADMGRRPGASLLGEHLETVALGASRPGSQIRLHEIVSHPVAPQISTSSMGANSGCTRSFATQSFGSEHIIGSSTQIVFPSVNSVPTALTRVTGLSIHLLDAVESAVYHRVGPRMYV